MAKPAASTQLETWLTAQSHAAGDPGTAVALREIHGSEAITPYMFGADPEDPWTDPQTAAVQAMLDAHLDSWDASLRAFRLVPYLCQRPWLVPGGVQMNNVAQPGAMLFGGKLIGSGAGTTVLDMAGLNSPRLVGVQIGSWAADPAHVGILHGRSDDGPFPLSPNVRWVDLDVIGNFTGAPSVSLANEVSAYIGCAFVNESMSLTARAHVNAGDYQVVLDSIGAVQSGAQLPAGGVELSNIIHTYHGCRFHRNAAFNAQILSVSTTDPAVFTIDPATANFTSLQIGSRLYLYDIAGLDAARYREHAISAIDHQAGTFELAGVSGVGNTFTAGRIQNATGPALTFGGSHAASIRNAYALAYREDGVLDFDMANSAVPSGFQWHGQIEHAPRRAIRVRNPASPIVWVGPEIVLSNQSMVNADETIGKSNAANVNIRGGRIQVMNMPSAPANGVFGGTGWGLVGGTEVSVPLAAALPPAGSLVSDDAVFTAFDRVPAVEDRRRVAFSDSATWAGHPPGTAAAFLFSAAGPHVLAVGLPDVTNVTTAVQDVVEVRLPADLVNGQAGTLTHRAPSGYSYLALAAGVFAGGQKRTVGQYGMIAWQCIGTAPEGPIVRIVGGGPMA